MPHVPEDSWGPTDIDTDLEEATSEISTVLRGRRLLSTYSAAYGAGLPTLSEDSDGVEHAARLR